MSSSVEVHANGHITELLQPRARNPIHANALDVEHRKNGAHDSAVSLSDPLPLRFA